MAIQDKEPQNKQNQLFETEQQWQLTHPLVITLSGPSGVGKTTVGKALADAYRIPYFKLGEAFRAEQAEQGKQVLDFVARPISDDQKRDALVANEIEKSISTEQSEIVEARLSGWIARKIESGNEQNQGKTFNILLTTRDIAVRMKRVRKREKAIDPQLRLSDRMAREATLRRETGDWNNWRAADPDLNLLSASCSDNPHWIYHPDNPNQLYDLVIETDNLSVDQVTQRIHEELLTRGLVTQ